MIPSQTKSRRQAFTLVELLVVISIIGVLAGFTLVVSKSVGKSRKISVAKGELAQIQTALENYKAKYGVYPPGNGYGDPLVNQLYYELSGMTDNGTEFVTLAGDTKISHLNPPNTDVFKAYKVGGFINCSKGGGEDAQAAKGFLLNLSSKQVADGVTNMSGGYRIPTKILVTAVGGPDDNYQPLDKLGLNPIRYVYPGVKNPDGYDLWVQLVINGKTNLVCNWSKSVQVNTSLP